LSLFIVELKFIRWLEIEGAEEREWIMMAVVNLGVVLEYGKPSGVLKRAAGVGPREADRSNEG